MLWHFCRHLQSIGVRTISSKPKSCCPPVQATAALHGTPGLLIGLGVFLAGVALAAFLLAAVPTLLVGICLLLSSTEPCQLPCSMSSFIYLP